MGHLINAKEEVYRALAERLNRNPVGAPGSEVLMEILHRLYTETEAMVGAKFPLVPLPAARIADLTGMRQEDVTAVLDGMAQKGLVLDLPRRDEVYYMLAPVVIGFFEYTFMRVREDLDMKELAELFERYFHNDEVKKEFAGGETTFFQTLVYESLIPAVVETEVLEYERASAIIRQSGGGALTMCACRHKASHLGKACDAPLDVCTSLGGAADWLLRRGLARPATVDDLLRTLDRTEKLGLVHMGDNVLNNPTYICHCCGCCCVVLKSVREYGKGSTHPSNFIPEVDREGCVGCGTCADTCHIDAISMMDDSGRGETPQVNKDLCLGCGVCAAACPSGALSMARRAVLHVPPENKKEQFLRFARERGKA
ncbi:MAG: 4Fe-4S dicluster domain-containing protein [Peptococcaceae bacterium]|nr:4Fe-4S dicluster domain-containing protein [Peptococcaceae bacterium]